MSEFKTDKTLAMVSIYTCTGNLPTVLHVKENYQCIKYINDVFFLLSVRHHIREKVNLLRILRESKTYSLTTFCEFTSRTLFYSSLVAVMQKVIVSSRPVHYMHTNFPSISTIKVDWVLNVLCSIFLLKSFELLFGWPKMEQFTNLVSFVCKGIWVIYAKIVIFAQS